MNLKSSMLERLSKRKQWLDAQYLRLIRKIDSEQIGGEEDRLWLEQWAQNSPGLDICCGDLLIGNSKGIDTADDILGADWFLTGGSDLRTIDDNSQNFIVCNYLDCFPDILFTLRAWKRVLKKDGTVAVSVRNSDNYSTELGPFINSKRVQAFTIRTLPFYFKKAGFKLKEIKLSRDNSAIYYAGTNE